jgi:CheY-like chemotaxis protein
MRQRILGSMSPRARRVEQASGGAEALLHLEKGMWQLLVLDRKIPDLDAEELSETVRQRYPAVEVVLLDTDEKGGGAQSADECDAAVEPAPNESVAINYGSTGEWIEKLGFAPELDVTSALALQWGCPVASSFESSIPDFPGIPLRILEAFQMLKLHYAASTNTLCIAVGARVDHAALYAIEKILDCRTQPCVAPPKRIARELESMRQLPRLRDAEFAMRDLAEMSRITSSYVSRLQPEEARLNRIGQFLWLRLQSHSVPTNVLFCLQPPSPIRPFPPEFPLPAQLFADSLHWAKKNTRGKG